MFYSSFLFIIAIFLLPMTSDIGAKSEYSRNKKDSGGLLRVMTLNAWHSGNDVYDGLAKIGKHIRLIDADIVLLQEISVEKLEELLVILGKGWDGIGVEWTPDTRLALLTKHKHLTFVTKEDKKVRLAGCGIGTGIHIAHLNRTVNAVSMHLNYLQYGPYAFVFVAGTAEQKGEEALKGDVQANGEGRLQQVKRLFAHPFVKEALEKARKGSELLIMGGDFNEPSHLDWTEETQHMHYGYAFEWPVTKNLAQAGLIDSFRNLYANATEFPGNSWSPIQKYYDDTGKGAHEPQDRIDFIFYFPNRLRPIKSYLYAGNPLLNKLEPNHAHNDWPSDHASVITEFEVPAPSADGPLATSSVLEEVMEKWEC